MYEFIQMFTPLRFGEVVCTFVNDFARWISYELTGSSGYDITDQEVGFIVALCTTLIWLFMSVVLAYLFIKIIILIVEGVLNW